MATNTNGQVQKSKEVMSRPEVFKAAHYLESKWEQLKNMTRVEAAVDLSNHIGKHIAPGTMCRLLRDIGKPFPGRSNRTGKKVTFTGNDPGFLLVKLSNLGALCLVFLRNLASNCRSIVK